MGMGHGPNRRLAVALWAALALTPGATAQAQVRSSASYRISFDAITAGGGPGRSAGFTETVSAVGQDVVYCRSTSPSFIEDGGFVTLGQAVPVTLSGFSVD